MKQILILLFCLFYSLLVFSQIKDTSIYIEGYVVFIKNKKDVLLKLQQEKNRECFESNLINYYKHTAFDFRYKVKYITTKCELEKWQIVDSTEILEIIKQPQKYEFYIFFYSSDTVNGFVYDYNEQLKVFITKNNINIPTNAVNTVNFNSCSDNYYTNSNDTANAYQFYYLKGYAVRHLVFNDYLNSKQIFSNQLNSFDVPRYIPAFFVYIWYKFDSIHCDIIPHGFKEWNPSDINCK
jgi:hypothetical protein